MLYVCCLHAVCLQKDFFHLNSLGVPCLRVRVIPALKRHRRHETFKKLTIAENVLWLLLLLRVYPWGVEGVLTSGRWNSGLAVRGVLPPGRRHQRPPVLLRWGRALRPLQPIHSSNLKQKRRLSVKAAIHQAINPT